MWEKISTKISRPIFILIISGLFTIGLAVFGFQWTAFSEHQKEAKELNGKIDAKMDDMTEELYEIKALIRKNNGSD
jgi:hypothetical protein